MTLPSPLVNLRLIHQPPPVLELSGIKSDKTKILSALPQGPLEFDPSAFPVLEQLAIQDDAVVPSQFHPSQFPALETLTIQNDTDISHTLPALLSSPQSCPSLATLKVFHCSLDPDFVQRLEEFASKRALKSRLQLVEIVLLSERADCSERW